MTKKKRTLALIPLRGGSKSIPRKNIKLLAGHPLCYWVITAALNCPNIDEVWVSTDDREIKSIAVACGAHVLDQPKKIATDTSTTESVMLHFSENKDFDLLVTLQATSPLTTSEDLTKALKIFDREHYDSLFTGVRWKRFFWKENGTPVNYDYRHRPRRQDFAGWIMENGAFYVTKRQILEKHKNRLGGKIGIFIQSDESSIELDEPSNWLQLETIINHRQSYKIEQKASKIKHIFTDFDGVFTDNTVFTNQDGIETVQTSKEDSLGLSLFMPKFPNKITVVSKERNPVVKARCAKLKLPVIQGSDNKKKVLEKYLKKYHLDWSEICFIGNDINDLDCLKSAGFSIAPADAHESVKTIVDYVTKKSGGRGAIREILTLFMAL